MTITTIPHVEVLDVRNLDRTNIGHKGYTMSKNALDNSVGSRYLCGDYGVTTFDGTLGLCKNKTREGNKIYVDVVLYDTNGYDVDMPAFVQAGLDEGAFFITPLINIREIVGMNITKADVISYGMALNGVN